jgi:hypothetical protein
MRGDAGIVGGVTDVALYYPYVNLPDDAWVKAAVLHWPQVGRIRPRGYYGLRDSETVKRLREEFDFVLDVRPGWDGVWVDEPLTARATSSPRSRAHPEDQVSNLFYDFLDRFQDELIPRYGVEAMGVGVPERGAIVDRLLPLEAPLEAVHPSKMAYKLAGRLAGAGLLYARQYRWRRADDGKIIHITDLAMHRRLAGVYLAVLADVIARQNRMTPVTDQPLALAASSGWTVDAMAQILLAEESDPPAALHTDYSQAFAVLALHTVIPRNIADVPVERIIEARRRLLPDMLRYREFLDSLASEFLEINQIPDAEVREATLRNKVERTIRNPLDRMDRELNKLGLQPARALLSMHTLAPPAALAGLLNWAGTPPALTATGMVAGCLVGAASNTLDHRRQTVANEPIGYLLSLRHELSPGDVVAGVRSAIRRATPQERARRRRHPGWGNQRQP